MSNDEIRELARAAIPGWTTPDVSSLDVTQQFFTANGIVSPIKKGPLVHMEGFAVDTREEGIVVREAGRVPCIPCIKFVERHRDGSGRAKYMFRTNLDVSNSLSSIMFLDSKRIVSISLKDGVACSWIYGQNVDPITVLDTTVTAIARARSKDEVAAAYPDLLDRFHMDKPASSAENFCINSAAFVDAKKTVTGKSWVLNVNGEQSVVKAARFVRFLNQSGITPLPQGNMDGACAVIGTPNGLTVLDLSSGRIRRWRFRGLRTSLFPGSG